MFIQVLLTRGSSIYLTHSFDDDLLHHRPPRQRLSRREKRQARHNHGLIRAKNEPVRKQILPQQSPLPDNLQQLQNDDESLMEVRELACQASQQFFKENGILYRKWESKAARELDEGGVTQLVLPRPCRQRVLQLAHAVPMAGHLGKKTTARTAQRFYWPTMHRNIADYCRGCMECQKTRRFKSSRAPMVPLPIVSEPFSRVAMDIVGPLPRSRSGHKYILVQCDYATRYPEAILLKNTDAETIAEELLTVFSRVGIPQEILTDQGSNFQSQLLKHLYRLLRVDAERTSPYHPQTDGLVERFNQTLKAMLRKTAMESGKDWDKLIPALLFAYREVPQESTGYSPFELLYGRDVRGPLDVLKHSWEGNHSIRNQKVVSYILLQRDKLEAMKEAVHNNLRKAQQQQKVWYDQNSRERSFAAGDWVLVLLPTSASKLTAQWQGPYRVVECMGKVNYAVHMHDHRKHRRVFHVNMCTTMAPTCFSVLFTASGQRERGRGSSHMERLQRRRTDAARIHHHR